MWRKISFMVLSLAVVGSIAACGGKKEQAEKTTPANETKSGMVSDSAKKDTSAAMKTDTTHAMSDTSKTGEMGK